MAFIMFACILKKGGDNSTNADQIRLAMWLLNYSNVTQYDSKNRLLTKSFGFGWIAIVI